MRSIACHFPIVSLAIATLSLSIGAAQEPPKTTAPAPPPADIPSLIKAGAESNMKGDYEAARQSFAAAWELAQSTPREDPIRYDILKRLVSIRSAVGEFADADNYLQMAINFREQTLGQNDPKVADDLLVSVGLCRGMKNYERARLIMGRVMGLHQVAYGPQSTAIADDFSRIALINMEDKNIPAAINTLNMALAIRGKLVSPLDPALVPDLDRLAGAYIASRDYPKAEETYRHALVIRETLYGKEDADLIASVDGLAYAMFGQKKYAEAEPVYLRLIALWSKSVGEDHPMVAIALDKVATFYADQKKFDQSKEAQERSNAIRAHFLATGLSVAATGQILQGNKDAAITLYKRALGALDPPNPIYDEMASQIAEIVKNMQAPPKVTKQTPPPRKK